jgi:hypothetical protein
MAARRKKDKKLAKKWQKKLKAIRKEAKKLDSDIQDLSDKLVKGNFRIL